MPEIDIHCVSSGEPTKGWVHTHGMAEYGLPELEIRDVPVFLCTPAGVLLRKVCDYMLDSGETVLLGDHMAFDKHTVFSFRNATPIPGEEAHFDVERWELTEAPGLCPCDECQAVYGPIQPPEAD